MRGEGARVTVTEVDQRATYCCVSFSPALHQSCVIVGFFLPLFVCHSFSVALSCPVDLSTFTISKRFSACLTPSA